MGTPKVGAYEAALPTGALRRDRGPRTHVPDALAEGVRGEAAVAHHPERRLRQPLQQAWRRRQLVRLARREGEGDRAPAALGDHAGLRAEAAARAAERLARVACRCGPPFLAAPAASWCARMVVPSRVRGTASDAVRPAMPSATPRACAASGRRSQTPRWPQRLKVWAAIHHGPGSAGMARQVAPFRCRQMIASIVRRRSWWSVLYGGRHASIRGASTPHCSSVRTFGLSRSVIPTR